MTPREIIKSNLRTIRSHHQWTQSVMAFACCVGRSTYSGWEASGGVPDLEQLQAIADRFSIGADLLLSCEIAKLPTGKRNEVLRGGYVGRQMAHYLAA